jgi:hypothetical protein
MSDIGTLTATAAASQAALDAAKAEQAAVAKAAAADAASRSVAWSWQTIVAYRQRQAIESEKVSAALAAFSAAVVEDLGLAASKYLDVVRRMAICNALGEVLVKARHILREAGKLPMIQRSGRDPIGEAAPFPLTHGMARLPSFIEMVTEAVDKQRMVASRVVSAEDPSTFDGKASPAMQTDALRLEWTLAQEYESLLAVKVQWPDRFAKLSAEEQADTLAYEATREAAGYSAELPKIAGARLRETEPPAFKSDAVVRVRLFSDEHAPSH